MPRNTDQIYKWEYTEYVGEMIYKCVIDKKIKQQPTIEITQFLNAEHEVKDLNAIFAALPEHTPPSGAGDCAAPKLLQYAYLNNLKPVAMAEFWWGAAPKSAIRQHKNYYPSCYSKCQPILSHMLKGLTIEDNPLLVNPAEGKTLPIVYQDDDIVIVNKPSEFLSVPGVNIEDSVYLRIQTQFPHATGPLIVHRLDMSTSGLLVVALNKRAHKALQKQFIARTIDGTQKHMSIILEEANNHKGTSFVEIYQNCNIFNDGAFSELTEKGTKAETQLVLEQGKPMIFGAENDKGLVLEGSNFKIVKLGKNYSADDILKHDKEDKNLAMLLSEITYNPDLPVPLGILYQESKPTYDDMMTNQIQEAIKSKGPGDLEKLFFGTSSWIVD